MYYLLSNILFINISFIHFQFTFPKSMVVLLQVAILTTIHCISVGNVFSNLAFFLLYDYKKIFLKNRSIQSPMGKIPNPDILIAVRIKTDITISVN